MPPLWPLHNNCLFWLTKPVYLPPITLNTISPRSWVCWENLGSSFPRKGQIKEENRALWTDHDALSLLDSCAYDIFKIPWRELQGDIFWRSHLSDVVVKLIPQLWRCRTDRSSELCSLFPLWFDHPDHKPLAASTCCVSGGLPRLSCWESSLKKKKELKCPSSV